MASPAVIADGPHPYEMETFDNKRGRFKVLHRRFVISFDHLRYMFICPFLSRFC